MRFNFFFTRKRKRDSDDAALDAKHRSDTLEAFPGIPEDVTVTHILSPDILSDPIDLARLRAVSHGMNDAVAASGRTIEEPQQEQAAELGYLSTLKHLHARGRLYKTAHLCHAAARRGQLEELQCFLAKGCPWGTSSSYAARGGHLEVLQWAHTNRYSWDTTTCDCAAEGGHLQVLKWLRLNGCPWDETTCEYAAFNGHLEVLQWARANGCRWSRHKCNMAVKGGHLEVLKWLRVNGCRISWWARHNAKIDLGYVEDDYVYADDSTLSSESTEFEDSDDDNDETSSDESLG